jgi:hypothetical protein
MSQMTRKTSYVLIASAAAAAAALVGARLYEADQPAPTRTLVVGSPSLRWPSETIRDWADFADQVAVLHIVSEEELPASADVLENGEGMIGRRVTARVEATLWRNHGSPALERTVSFTTWGWVVHEGVRIPTVDSSSARIEVGDRVVAPLLLAPEGEWAPLAPSAVIKLDRGRMTLNERQRVALPQLSAELNSHQPVAIAELLANTPARPDAAILRRLNADQRAAALAAQN